MKITKMTPSQHVKDRWFAVLEDGTSLKLTVALIADYGLFSGRELTDGELEALRQDAGKTNAKERAARIVGARPVSRKELVRRLMEKGENPENAEEAAAAMERIGAVNDEEYAAMIVRHYFAKGFGLGRVRDELYRRGVPKELWEDALAEMPDTAETLDALVAQKLRGRSADKKELKKLTDTLCRRGFSWEEIRGALARYGEETEESAD